MITFSTVSWTFQYFQIEGLDTGYSWFAKTENFSDIENFSVLSTKVFSSKELVIVAIAKFIDENRIINYSIENLDE